MSIDSLEKVSTKKSVAVFYPLFSGGGAESVCLWILEALKETYDLTLFTLFDVDFDKLNSMYGTQLSQEIVKVKLIFPTVTQGSLKFLFANNRKLTILAMHLLLRYLKAHNQEYDLLLSGYNAVDFGRVGIQYVHWVNVIPCDGLYGKISNFSLENIKLNISITNSFVVSKYFKDKYAVDSKVVYPPVLVDPQNISWEQKENAFICSGRWTAAKAPHKAIQILKKVRQKGFDVKLYITGGGGGIYGWKYKRTLTKMAKENSEWVELCENLPYKDYVNILSKCRYGIHCKLEPFGISIAEMMKAGAIPVVKSKRENPPGQVEILGEENQELFFENKDEAVEKITNILQDSGIQQKLQASLLKRKDIFSTDKFMTGIRQVVKNYFEQYDASHIN
ncbi:MAG: glycosyltransferase [Okeania sp. SIO2F4]|uniref:glycosyltransferase n=1 Tax=Okeania sp. SIO2F4 TaxID=2607790 RepID=UPI00142B3FF8|nr:glycosyltransferase [Okeania sp. SIO2F4]NES02127.1 glycosyltransferase [Okeania sp. SIO2F4]